MNATFSVKADAYVDTYDGKPHTVTVTADGAKISYSADAGNYKTYGSTAPTFTDVGEYTLTPAGGSAKNYTFNYVSGTLTILRRPSNPGSTISVPSTPNGTVTVTPSTATKDTTVTITTKPNEGYELGDLTVKDANGNALPLTDKGDGKYTFTMPASKVEVKAAFKQTASKPDKPAEEMKTVVVMQIGSKTMFVNGKAYEKDAAPVIMNDRTLVPIRFVTESLGGTVAWNAETKEVTLVIDGKEIKMTIGKTIEKYGVAPVIIDSRTFVPVRFVADELGANVAWDDATKTVTIKTAR